MMASESDTFSCSGLSHLTTIDWNERECQTIVMSNLVEMVYIMAGDAQTKANTCLKSFSLCQTLIDESDNSIFSAVFKYNFYDDYQNTPHLGTPPQYVVAIRGTMLKPKTWASDMGLNIRCIFDDLQHGARFKHALKVIKWYVARYGNTVWLAGHSLGAGLALLAGKTMAMSGFPLQAHIFNPPISSVILKVLVSNRLKLCARIVGNIAKAGIVKAAGHDKGEKEVSFKKLADWKPYLYVNPSDGICSEYIPHFEGRIKISKMGWEKIVKLAIRYPKPLHLIPSAFLIINTGNSKGPMKAHGIREWMDPISDVKSELYEFN